MIVSGDLYMSFDSLIEKKVSLSSLKTVEEGS